MPVHDWTKVSAGIYHDFHNAWLAELRKLLNRGLLPPGSYALIDQVAGKTGPYPLSLQGPAPEAAPGRAAAVATVTAAPPQVRSVARMEHSNDRIVAMIEILSPGNKA